MNMTEILAARNDALGLSDPIREYEAHQIKKPH